MPSYEIELMPGQNAHMGDDPNKFIYQIREYDGAGYVKDKRFSKIRFTNLTNEKAHQLLDSLEKEKTE